MCWIQDFNSVSWVVSHVSTAADSSSRRLLKPSVEEAERRPNTKDIREQHKNTFKGNGRMISE
jgi:hypothetical protein